MDMPAYSQERTRLAPRLAELDRKLEKPTPQNIAMVRAELQRLARG